MSDDTMKRKTFAESLNEDWGNPDIWGPWTVPDPSEGLKFYKSLFYNRQQQANNYPRIMNKNFIMDLNEKEMKAIAALIIEKSQVSNFAEVQMTKNSIVVSEYYDLVYDENEEGINTLSMRPCSKKVQLATYQTSAAVAQEQIHSLKGDFGIDVISMVKNTLVNETAMVIMKNFKKELNKLATITYLGTYTKCDKFKAWFYKIFKKEYIKVVTVKTPKALLNRIVAESQRLSSISRRGPVEYIIVNGQTAAILMDLPSYTIKPSGTITLSNGNVYEAGSIAGLRVFVDPFMEWKNSTVFFGRKVKTGRTWASSVLR